MSQGFQIQSLDDVSSVGNSTLVLQPLFGNGLIARAASTTVPGLIADQTNISSSSAGSISIRLVNSEFINYKFNSSVAFAGAVMSWPASVTYNGMANSTLSIGAFFTSGGFSVFTGVLAYLWGTTAANLVGSSDLTKVASVSTNGAATSTTSTLTFIQTANRAITFPDATDTLVGKATTDTLTNKTIVAANNTISGLLHGTQVDNPSSAVHGVAGSIVGTTDSQTLTNKDLQGTTNIFPTKARRFLLSVYVTSFRNGAGGKIFGEGTASGFQPIENIHLTKVTFGGNVTVNLAATNCIITVYKGAQSAGNECFQITQSIAATGQFRSTDTTVNNSGKDAITTSDQLSIDVAIGAGTSTINNPYIILEGTYDSA